MLFRLFDRVSLLALILCFGVVVFGAYVRLSDAGLGCPDWPGCYGHVGVPDAEHELAAAREDFPQRPVEAPKAWKEMIHRYLASALGLLLLALAVLARMDPGRSLPRGLTAALVGTVLVQGALGALTVLWNVNPLTVTGHLVVGLTTLALLAWLLLSRRAPAVPAAARAPAPLSGCAAWFELARPGPKQAAGASAGLIAWTRVALALLAVQIVLGGWTSSNYAAAACPDFPTCQGHWLPPLDLGDAFTPWRGLGVNYQYGVLDGPARMSIHFIHRVGALAVTVVVGGLALYLLLGAGRGWKRWGTALAAALALQLSIGIGLVEARFPLWLGDAHNAGAALLLLVIVALNFLASRSRTAR
jgi:cytochrome c oxidase assembly protein subunit 15